MTQIKLCFLIKVFPVEKQNVVLSQDILKVA